MTSSNDGHWREYAACRNQGDQFFSDTRGLAHQHHVAAAKQICATCPVTSQCLEWALDHEQQYGVWGGAGPQELRTMIRDRRRSAQQKHIGEVGS